MTDIKTYKTSKADFEYFKKRCIYWVEKLKCDDWEWRFEHGPTDNSLATWNISWKGRALEITLEVEWSVKVTKKQLDKTAFHEVFEAGILSELRACAMAGIAADVVVEECHKVVRKMENLFLGY